MEEVRTQASLGTEFRRLYNEDSNIDKLILGKVINVNYRYNTVDVQSISDRSIINKPGQDGKFSAKLPVQFSGRTVDGKPFGQITPIEEGALVLVGFINKQKSAPIVLSVYNSAEETHELARAPFGQADQKDESIKKQSNHKFTVYPSLTYEDIDGNGNRTVSFTGKSFITIDGDTSPEMSGVNDSSYNYEDLASSHYYSGELIEPTSTKAPTILFKHTGDHYNDDGELEKDPHELMLFIGQDGTYRTSIVKDGEDWRTYTELTSDGTYTIRRQNDSREVGKGQNYHEFAVTPEGISMRSGGKFFLFNQDGISGNTGFGGIGGADQDEFDKLVKRVTANGETILSMSTKFEKTDEYIRLSAEKTVEFEGKLKEMDASFEVRADAIEQRVTEIITDLVDEGLQNMVDDLSELQQLSLEALNALRDLSEDGKLTNVEKKTVLREWDMIRTEYPGYKQQAVTMEVDTVEYDRWYNSLKAYITPILANMEVTTEIDRVLFNSGFQNYYSARGDILYAVFQAMKAETDAINKKAIEAGIDAGTAIGDSAIAKVEAERANRLLTNIASDDKVTPQEKPQLKKEYNEIIGEWESIVDQAIAYDVSTMVFEGAKDSVIAFITSTGVLGDLTTTADIDGAQLQLIFATYYEERAKLYAEVIKASKVILDGFSGQLEYFNTSITSTSRQITLVAESIKFMETEIENTRAELSVQSEKISLKVSRVEMVREVNDTLEKLNAGGRNLYSKGSDVLGKLSITTGVVESSTNGSRTSDFMKVDADTDYIATVYGNVGLNTIIITWYDREKKFITASTVSNTTEMVTLKAISPSNAVYAKSSYALADNVSFQFEKGTVTTPHKASPEDMVADITVATKEHENRQKLFNEFEAKLQEGKANGLAELAKVETWSDNMNISATEKVELKTLYSAVVAKHTTALAEAEVYSVSTIAFVGAYASLKAYVDEVLLEANTGSSQPVIQASMVQVFQEYYTQRARIYEGIVDKAKSSLEASEKILDDASKGAMRAQELADRLAKEADVQARSVVETRNNIDTANQYQTKAMAVLDRVAQDSQLTPTEKVEVTAIIEKLAEDATGLKQQAGTYSLSTTDLENAVTMLSAYYSAFITTEKRRETSAIAKQTFLAYFTNIFEAKVTLLQNILEGAKGAYDKAQEESNTAYQEFLRKEEQMITYQNAIKDSLADITRINGKIDDLENAVPYRYEILSTKGDVFMNSNIDTEITVKLFKGNEDITSKLSPNNIVWTKTNDDGTLDTVWNASNIGVGKTIRVTHNEVNVKAIFDVELFIEEGT